MRTEPLSYELFVPSDMMDTFNWNTCYYSRQRGVHICNFAGAKPNYPQGIRNTPYEGIVWSYTVYLP